MAADVFMLLVLMCMDPKHATVQTCATQKLEFPSLVTLEECEAKAKGLKMTNKLTKEEQPLSAHACLTLEQLFGKNAPQIFADGTTAPAPAPDADQDATPAPSRPANEGNGELHL